MTVSQFHARCAALQRQWPTTMVTTSTHDTKRSEDVRARLAVLSEQSGAWIETVRRWSESNSRYRDEELDAPDRHDEWFIYQTLAGAHPLPLERAWPVIEKSLREAKQRTSWVRVNEPYEHTTRRFLESILADDRFVSDLERVVAPLVEPGQVNALTQVALRLLGPGVPDTYQGCELWDLSLVDPDNRGPVDYEERRRIVAAIGGATAAELWSSQRETGAPKLALVQACLQLRRRHPAAFGREGTYVPLTVTGPDADRVIAFARTCSAVALVPLRPTQGPPEEAVIALPDGEWTNVLTHDRHSGEVAFAKLRGGFPVAVLEADLDPVV
jgi:(1->4)-alpha-D-glucan 1-alpha-D-glucosylmutase